jgi:hypothetical protein
MRRLIAIGWDDCEVRYVVAAGRGDKLSIVGASSKEMEASPEGVLAEPIFEWLRGEVGSRLALRIDSLVCVGRGDIEVLHLNLPPAQDDELPELVRNQAIRQLAAIGDDSLLDFVPLETPTGERSVTAVAMGHEQHERLVRRCREAGVTPKRIVVRTYAAASLLARRLPQGSGPCLMINCFSRDADLAVVSGGKVPFWRTVILPVGGDAPAVRLEALVQEVVRTRLIVERQTGPIEKVYLLGRSDEHAELLSRLAGALPEAPQLIDPFEDAACGGVDSSGITERTGSGRFAPLVGALLDHYEQQRPAIDLLHPRRKPRPPNRRRLFAIAGALLVLVTMLGGQRVWDEFSQLDAERADLESQIKELDDLVKQANRQQSLVEAVRDWKGGDVVLLDELRDLSLRLPNARDMVVLRMSKTASRSGWCLINLQGLVRDPLVVSRMERRLRDQYHEIRSPRGQGQAPIEDYTWRFESTVTVAQRPKEAYVSHLPGWQPGFPTDAGDEASDDVAPASAGLPGAVVEAPR